MCVKFIVCVAKLYIITFKIEYEAILFVSQHIQMNGGHVSKTVHFRHKNLDF